MIYRIRQNCEASKWRLTRLNSSVLLLAAVVVTALPAWAEVKVGDKAPPLIISEWLKHNPFDDWAKGKPLDLAKSAKGKVVLLEFWATWCAPCIQLIPHNNELNQRYKDKGLVFISLTDTSRGQQLSTVKRFVDSRGDGMDYPLAFDEMQRTTFDYVATGGAVALPQAVLIGKDGKVVWTGHPAMPAMEIILQDLLLDRYDPEKIKRKAAMEARLEPLIMDFNRAASVGDWKRTIDTAERMLTVDPSNKEAIELSMMIFLNELRDRSAMRAWGDRLVEKYSSNPDTMLTLASALLALPDMENRQPDIALRAAQAAYGKRPRDAAIVQTLADVAYQIGDIDRAIALQRDAVRVADIFQADTARERLRYLEACKALHPKLTASGG